MGKVVFHTTSLLTTELVDTDIWANPWPEPSKEFPFKAFLYVTSQAQAAENIQG